MTEDPNTPRRCASGAGWTRRRFLAGCGLAGLAGNVPWVGAAVREKGVSVGQAFDAEIEEYRQPRSIPGAAVAVVRNRRLVYAKGYGWADREKRLPATPESLFRIASISKSLTGVAVMKLVEDKKLELDAPAIELLGLRPVVKPATMPDHRLPKITVRHLLHHTAGWDRDVSPDPMFRAREIAAAVGVTCPPGPRDIIRYMLGQPLDFNPGSKYAYSNFGYCVLGRIIEAASGQPYEKHVQEKLLAPLGIRRMRLGSSEPAGQAEGEVRYYQSSLSKASNVYGDPGEKVPWPYGGFHLGAMDAHGGWIASVIDLARFAAALDEPRRSPLLSAGTIRTMYAPPPAPVARKGDGSLKETYYACGWSVRKVGNGGLANYWHNGSLPGTFSLLVRRWDGLSWVVLFNRRSEDIKLPDAAIDAAMHRAADAVTEWPEEDLFERS